MSVPPSLPPQLSCRNVWLEARQWGLGWTLIADTDEQLYEASASHPTDHDAPRGLPEAGGRGLMPHV